MTRRFRTKISGYYAGPVSRLLAYGIDMFVAVTAFGLLATSVVGTINLALGAALEWDWRAGVFGITVFSVWMFLYLWVGTAISGRTLGKGIVGIKVVCADGNPISPGRAAARVLVLPISIITVVGALGIVFDQRQRALHDRVAGTAVVYDWGDRPAELPAPLSEWLAQRGVGERWY